MHEAKVVVMAGKGTRAKETPESVVKLKGAIEDNVVYRALLVLADVHVLHGKWVEAEDMFLGFGGDFLVFLFLGFSFFLLPQLL